MNVPSPRKSKNRIPRHLATVLFTDIVGSTEHAVRLGDQGWQALLAKHNEIVRDQLGRFEGQEVSRAGDSFLTLFEGPGLAILCACAIRDEIRKLGLEVRCGVHMGQVEHLDEGDVGGVAVHVGSRVSAVADPGEVLVTSGVRDAELGSGFGFKERGLYDLKGVPGTWTLYSITSVPEDLPEVQRGPLRVEADKSIAVLPFANLSADPENEFFSDGVSEELINCLTKLTQLRVCSRTSSFSYKGKNVHAGRIAEELGVGTILEGSVRRSGDRIRITAQLIDPTSDAHLWSETYDRDLEDIFAVQDEIACNIANALQITLSPKEKREIEKVSTSDVQAYDHYLRARQFFYEQRGGSLESALELFSKAIEVDPEYALAHAGIAYCEAYQYLYFDSDENHVNQAERASRRALELDPELAEAHTSHGVVLSLKGRMEEAQDEFETAIRIDPALFEAYYFYARHVLVQGRFHEAARLLEKAIEARPSDYTAASLVVQVYRSLGQNETAKAVARRALRIIEKHLDLNPDDHRAISFRAVLVVELGDVEEGVAMADSALREDPDPSVLYNLACAYSLAGQVEKSLDCLEKTAAMGPMFKVWVGNDSDLDAVRNHPRFEALLKKLA